MIYRVPISRTADTALRRHGGNRIDLVDTFRPRDLFLPFLSVSSLLFLSSLRRMTADTESPLPVDSAHVFLSLSLSDVSSTPLKSL